MRANSYCNARNFRVYLSDEPSTGLLSGDPMKMNTHLLVNNASGMLVAVRPYDAFGFSVTPAGFRLS
jgi:hypothetical protein